MNMVYPTVECPEDTLPLWHLVVCGEDSDTLLWCRNNHYWVVTQDGLQRTEAPSDSNS